MIYIATACRLDDDPDWQQRIERHRQRRPEQWRTIESPYDLPRTIRGAATEHTLLLIDCLTVWLSNLMVAEHPVAAQQAALLQAVEQAPGRLILVSNEVGMGIVPDHPLGRRFRDAQGVLNQSVAATCDRVELVIAGLPFRLKG